jgi:hypothetical protein
MATDSQQIISDVDMNPREGFPPPLNPWHDGVVPKRSSPKRDFMEVARGVVEQAIGEQMDGTPLPQPEPDTRNPHAVALGSMGGRKGGKARAKKLSRLQRMKIAKKGAKARWRKS